MSITGDIDIRIRLALNPWIKPTPQVLIQKNGGASQLSWLFYVFSFGTRPAFEWTVDGTTQLDLASSEVLVFADGSAQWLRVTLDVDNGAVGHDAKFYTSENGLNWSQLGTTQTGVGVTSIFDSSADLEITGTIFLPTSKIYYAEVRNGIDGPVVAKFDPNKTTPGATSFVSSTGETWTINQSGSPKAEIQ